MPHQRMIPFKIQSMDSLGQGVSKETDKITFINKTLPGDQGEARITASKKGVQFAKLHSLQHPSSQRIDPICPHFNQCPSCHYLHTPYEQELLFKQQALERMFSRIPHPTIKVTPALRRTHYRNRIQLHYNLKTKQLGMLDAKDHSIAPIPDCLIGLDELSQEIKKLYHNEQWLKLCQGQPGEGHVELYALKGKVTTTWNAPYAHGGFTQVFDEMNQLLKQELATWSHQQEAFSLLDLFAGNGNLSDNLNYSSRLCVDFYQNAVADYFYSQDLYAAKAIQNVKKTCTQNQLKAEVILVDPPRSGLKNLNLWLAEFNPSKVLYVSCDPHTLVRDIAMLDSYQVVDLQLFDFFPSTFHFETVAFLERK